MSSTVTAFDLTERVASVRGRIAEAAERAGRMPNDITLIAVTKTWPAAMVVEALKAGLTDFGENRVQEACAKADDVEAVLPSGAMRPSWHLIGHLQSNKVRLAAGRFSLIHSVDSEKLMRAVDASAPQTQDILIEVNVSGEDSKEGIPPSGLPMLLELAESLPNLEVRGLMTVAPHVPDPELVRPVFRTMAQLAARHGLKELSMGMTNDYEVAIEEGATMVRVGRALFGDRE